MTKCENMSDDEIIDNYKRLKLIQREKNRTYYNNLKNNPTKYKQRLEQATEQQQKRIEDIKNDPDLFQKYNEKRMYSNALYYYSHH